MYDLIDEGISKEEVLWFLWILHGSQNIIHYAVTDLSDSNFVEKFRFPQGITFYSRCHKCTIQTCQKFLFYMTALLESTTL